MLVIRDYCGVPQPEQGSPLCMQAGDVVELISANPHISWWQVCMSLVVLVGVCVCVRVYLREFEGV